MRKSAALLLIAALLLGLFGCVSRQVQVAGGVWVSYREDTGTIKSEDQTEIFVYSYQQPVLQGNAPGLHMINTKLDNATTAFLYGSGGVEEMTELAKMDWRESWFNCYRLDRKVSVARLDDAVVSFRYSDYAFSGGVHGYIAEYGVNYDMVSGAQLEFRDLTDDEWALREVCRMHIMAELEDEEKAEALAVTPYATREDALAAAKAEAAADAQKKADALADEESLITIEEVTVPEGFLPTTDSSQEVTLEGNDSDTI